MIVTRLGMIIVSIFAQSVAAQQIQFFTMRSPSWFLNMTQTEKNIMIEYAKSFIGTKYKWGGESADEGFDCSGFVQEVLRSEGIDPPGDQTAQDLFDIMKDHKSVIGSGISENSLLFFGGARITHVAIAINGWQMIEAGGEGRTPTNLGMVRIRPIKSRKDLRFALRLDV